MFLFDLHYLERHHCYHPPAFVLLLWPTLFFCWILATIFWVTCKLPFRSKILLKSTLSITAFLLVCQSCNWISEIIRCILDHSRSSCVDDTNVYFWWTDIYWTTSWLVADILLANCSKQISRFTNILAHK